MNPKAKSLRRYTAFFTLGLALLLFILYMIHVNRTPKYPTPIPIYTRGQAELGDKHAPVHLVVFQDISCIHCQNFHNQVFHKIKQNYIDDGTVKYTPILVSVIPRTEQLALAFFCVKNFSKEAFFELLNRYYGQVDLKSSSTEDIEHLIQNLVKDLHPKVNYQKFHQCFESKQYSSSLFQNTSYGKDLSGGRLRVPLIYVNGMKAQDDTYDYLVTLIKHAKKHHRKKKEL